MILIRELRNNAELESDEEGKATNGILDGWGDMGSYIGMVTRGRTQASGAYSPVRVA